MQEPFTAPHFRLPNGFLEELVGELDRSDVVGIVLGGSHARGAATELSDVDIAVFVRERAHEQLRRHFYRRGILVSVATKSIEGVRADMVRPRAAVRVVPGLASANVLLDKGGSIARLMRDLNDFEWEPLREAAGAQVSHLMYGFVEPLQKLANEIARGNLGGVAYVVDQVVNALTEAVVLYRGVLVQSDSMFYSQAQQAAGEDSTWAKCHAQATGLGGEALDARARACLELYRLTMDLVRPVVSEEHAVVVDEALYRVATARQ